MASPLDLLRRVPGAVWGLLALAAGMILGTLYPAQLGWIGAGVGFGFKGLAAAAPYIIFFTISAAVIDMLNTGKAGSFALWVSIVFTGLGFIAGVLAIFLAVPLFSLEWGLGDIGLADVGLAVLGFFFVVSAGVVAPGVKVIPDAPDLAGVLGYIVTHIWEIARTTPSFTAVFFAAFSAILLNFGNKWKGTAWFTRPTMDMVRRIGVDGLALVGRGLKVAFPFLLFGIGIFIPTAISKAVEKTEEGLGTNAQIQTVVGSDPVALYFLTVWMQVVALAIFILTLIVIVCLWTRFSLKQFFKEYFLYVYPFAWATSSSAASIPVNLERTGTGLKVRKEIREFVIPLGATVNLDGAIMACFIITAMAAILVGYRPTFVDLVLLLIPIKIVTLGVPGIPGGIAAVVPPVVAEILPLPPGTDAAFLAIWFGFSVGLSDQFRTGVNTTTNGIVSLGFEKVYDRYFAKQAASAPVTSETTDDAVVPA